MPSTGSDLIDSPRVEEPEPAPPRPRPAVSEGSLERLEQLRRQLDAAGRQREAVAAELARQEAIWEAQEAERRRQACLSAAREEFRTAQETYLASSSESDAAFGALREITCRVAAAYKAAVRAERARRNAAPELREAGQRLRELGEDLELPAIAAPRPLVFDAGDPRQGAMLAGLLAYPGIKRELAQLDTADELPPSAATTNLEALLTRAELRRGDASQPSPAVATTR